MTDPEWLLWREQYKIQSRSFSKQLSSLTQATSKITDATEQVSELAAGSERLNEGISNLENQISHLQKDLYQQDQLSKHLGSENDVLKKRVLHLEQDANQQDQINAMSSQAKGNLERELGSLKRDHMNVIEAVGTLLENAKAERAGQRKELETMKAQMNAFTADVPQQSIAPTGREARDLAGLFPTTSRGSRDMSQATTVDDNIQPDTERETQLFPTVQSNSLPDTTQLYTQYSEATQLDVNIPKPNIIAQGSLPIEEYIQHGDAVINQSVRLFEAQAVRNFVGGMRDRNGQQLLSEKLDKVGWTWENAKGEMHQLIMDNKQRKRNKKRIMPGFL